MGKPLNRSKVILTNILLWIFAGLFCLFAAIMCCTIDTEWHTGTTVYQETYGGDAYTGIQNAAAATANNVQTNNALIKEVLKAIKLVSASGFFCASLVCFAQSSKGFLLVAEEGTASNDNGKNTRNGQSKMQIDENINAAEAEAEKIVAEKKAKEAEEAGRLKAEQKVKEVEEPEINATLDDIRNLQNLPERVSQVFVNSLKTSAQFTATRAYLEAALEILINKSEIKIVKLLLELPNNELKKVVKQLINKYDI